MLGDLSLGKVAHGLFRPSRTLLFGLVEHLKASMDTLLRLVGVTNIGKEFRWRDPNNTRKKVAILLTTEYQEFGILGAAIITKEQIDQTL